jgi:hypothetical protein
LQSAACDVTRKEVTSAQVLKTDTKKKKRIKVGGKARERMGQTSFV